jgi:hypothetical protein
MLRSWWSLLLVSAVLGCSKKPAEPATALEGWHKEEAWRGSCFYPTDFSKLGVGDRRLAWQRTRDALMGQWSGSRQDGVKMSDKGMHNLETALLAKADRIEDVSATNLSHCQEAMANGSTIAWINWLDGLAAELTVGECPYPKFHHTLYDYLNISDDWQIPGKVCKDDYIKLKATSQDYYRISDDGPWINAEGDTNLPTAGDYPCNVEGCFAGMVIMRFTGESGIEVVQPVGTYTTFRAPEHGEVEVMINDISWYDNKFQIVRGLEHHTGIEYSPVSK